MADIEVTATGNVNDLLSAMDKAGRAGGKMASDLEKAGQEGARSTDSSSTRIVGALKKIAVGAGLLYAGKKAFEFGKWLVDGAADSEKVAAQTTSVLKATGGAAKITEAQVGDLATAISRKTATDDEAVQSGENMLLTFKNIRNETGKGNDVFNQSTSVLADMSRAMGTDMSTQAIQLGKALNDPIKGVGALSKVGVTFDDQQKKQIKTMVAAGNVMGAQKVILKELNGEFGGSGAAYAGTYAGKVDALKISFGNLQETAGGLLIPVLGKVADGITKLFDRAQDSGVIDTFGAKATAAFGQAKAVIGPFISSLAPLVPQVVELASSFSPLSIVLKALLPVLPDISKLLGAIEPALSSLIQAATGVTKAVVGWLVPITQSEGGMAALKAGVVALIAGFAAFKAVQGVMAAFAAAQKVATALQIAWNIAMTANPIGIVIVAVAALVAGLAYFFTQTKAGQAIWAGFTKFLGDAWKGFSDWIGTALKGIVSFFAAWWTGVQQNVQKVVGVVQSILDGWGKVVSFFQQLPAKVLGFLAGIATWLVASGKKLLDGLVDGAKDGLVAFGRWELTIGSKVIGWLAGAGRWLVETGHDVLDGMVDGAKSGLVAFGRWEIGIGKAVIGWLAGAGSWLIETGTNVLHGLASGARSGFGTVSSFVSSIPGKIQGAVGNGLSILRDVGGNIVAGLTAGLRAGWGAVTGAIHNLVNAIPAAARKLLGIQSPSKVFREIGKFVGAGLVQGLDGSQDQVSSAMASLADKVTSAFNSIGDSREAAQKRLKTLDGQLADVDQTTKAGKKRAAALRSQISEQKSLVSQLNKATGLKSSLTAELKADTATLSRLAAQRDALVERLKDAQSNLADAVKTRDDFASGVSSGITGQAAVTAASGSKDADGNDLAVTASDIIAQKQKVLGATQQFTQQLAQLKAVGLNDADYKSLIDNFQSTGDGSFAAALVAGGPDAVRQVNDLNAQLTSAATSLGSSTASQLYGAGVQAAQGVVDGLQSQITNVTGAMGVVQASLATAVSKIGVDTSALASDAAGKITAALANGMSTTQLEKAVANVSDLSTLSKKQVAAAKARMADAGDDIIAGLAAGLKGKSKKLDDVFDDLSSGMVKRLKKALGIKSPSTVFRDEVGQYIPAGVVEGIEAGAPDVEAAAARLATVPTVTSGAMGTQTGRSAATGPVAGGAGAGAGGTTHVEVTIAVPPKADRDDVEYAEDMLGAVRFAVSGSVGAGTGGTP